MVKSIKNFFIIIRALFHAANLLSKEDSCSQFKGILLFTLIYLVIEHDEI